MHVLFVSSEVYPLAKTGGLADVSQALPAALARMGADVRLLLPGYPQALDKAVGKRVEADLGDAFGAGGIRLIAGRLPIANLPLWLVEAPQLYGREGGLYQSSDGRDWPDNAVRFATLSHVGARLALGIAETGWQPDVVHANDWHTGLLPLVLASTAGHRPATLFTIHNMAFQGSFPGDLDELGIPEQSFIPDGLEFHGQVSFLKAGIRYSDRLTTVSPTYAREVRSPEFGFGLEGLLQERADDLVGILNGVDYGIWDPLIDPYLPTTYGLGDIAGKRICKARLQDEVGLAAAPDVPIIAFASRLTHQKMADVVLAALPWITGRKVQFVLHGQGDRDLESAFGEVASQHPEKVVVRIGYDEPFAHRLQAGADILLAPSRFEPCGLTQLYALRYGTLPIVRRTGGCADTVVDSNRQAIAAGRATGFVFDKAAEADMVACISRSLALYAEPLAWRRIQLQAIRQDFGWATSARQYMSLYRALAAERLAAEWEEDGSSHSDSTGEGRELKRSVSPASPI